MTIGTRTAKALALGAVMLLGGALLGQRAEASVIVTVAPVGNNIVASGSGTIDLTDLQYLFTVAAGEVRIAPTYGQLDLGVPPSMPVDIYGGTTGPTHGYPGFVWGTIPGPANMGPGGITVPNSGSGDIMGPASNVSTLQLPAGYVSGDPLSGTATWDNATFASLGVTPGTYVWTWGTGDHADSFTIEVPEPGSLALLATAVIGLAVAFRRSRHAGA